MTCGCGCVYARYMTPCKAYMLLGTVWACTMMHTQTAADHLDHSGGFSFYPPLVPGLTSALAGFLAGQQLPEASDASDGGSDTASCRLLGGGSNSALRLAATGEPQRPNTCSACVCVSCPVC
jgi:hypothetical protein